MYSPTSRHHAETPRSCLCRQVRLMTTGGGSVHFNPNLYSCGKVCLSILGTWSGPAWTPVQNLTSVLLSIQSLLSTDPYYNEPGVPRNVVASERYSDYVRHETIRVAVLDMVGDTSLARSMPPKLLSVARSLFIAHFPVYRDTCEEHAKRNPEGAAFADPLGRTTRPLTIGDSIRGGSHRLRQQASYHCRRQATARSLYPEMNKESFRNVGFIASKWLGWIKFKLARWALQRCTSHKRGER